MSHATNRSHLFDQPRAVWAVAAAAVVAFMGIGLVDPILPAIGRSMDATTAQVELLFTSYMAVTGLAMLVTGWVSSRIGAKRTLLAGLALVVVFATLAGASSGIGEIVGFRAGWGLGNALFIATALATIVGAASGGVASAIILYEAALGVGIASGPLLGGLLGNLSWRAPFFGTAALMAAGFVAILVLLPPTPRPATTVAALDPIRALRHRGLLIIGLVALFYNFGFFTLLAYTPFPLGMGAIGLGLVFFGWGLALALTSVFLAPVLQRRFGTTPVVRTVLALFALVLLVMALFVTSIPLLVAMVVVSGLLLGVNNTLVTEIVMKVSPVARPVASAGYSFLRFIGGAIAPWLAGHLADQYGPRVPYYVGVAGVLVALGIFVAGRSYLTAVDEPEEDTSVPTGGILLAVDDSPESLAAIRVAAEQAGSRGLPVHVLHVDEVAVTPEGGIDLDEPRGTSDTLDVALEMLLAAGIQATGAVRTSVGEHADVARTILAEAALVHPRLLVVGGSRQSPIARAVGADVADAVRHGAGDTEVLVVTNAALSAAPTEH